MASEANSVTISTNFNVDPYYDDFDESKNFHRILFRPGLAVQARELTQIQDILQTQIGRFAVNILKEGAKVSGCEQNYDQNFNYVKLRDKASNGTTVANVHSFLGKTIKGVSSGVQALVVAVADGSEANTPNFKTLFVKYTMANTSGNRFFANNEIINSTAGSFTANTIKSTQGASVGHGSAVTIASGVVYAKQHFIRVAEQVTILDKYSANATCRVGFDINESIITEADDTSLLDPASGSYNYTAPGATRFKLSPVLTSKSIDETSANNFIELFQVKSGILQSITDTSPYAQIRDYMARRTSDEAGDYTINGLSPRLREHLSSGTNQGVYTVAQGGDANKLVVDIQPGKAYVNGYDLEKIVTTSVALDKGIDYNSVQQGAILGDIGNYVVADNVVGDWDVNNQLTITLRDTQANSISTGNFSLTNFPGASIGTARVRAIEYLSGTPGLPSAQYKMYLSDIKITTGGKSFANVQSIAYSGGAGQANGKADIVGATGTNAATTDTAFEVAIFPIPSKAIRKLRDTSGNVNNEWQFIKSYDIQFATTTGIATLASGVGSETFTGSGVISSSAAREFFHVVARASANTANLTGTVTITYGSNSVSGSSTSFTTQVNPGDIIACSPTDKFIVSEVTNNSTLKLVSAAGANRSGTFHKRFLQGQVIDMAGVGKNGARSVNITSSTGATLSTNESLSAALNATAFVKMNKVDGQEAAKTVNRSQLVEIRVGAGGGTSYTANTTGPWPLGRSDGFKLVSVRKKSGSNFAATTDGTDVTSNFILDTGMRDGYYDHARLVKNPTSTLSIANGDRLLVTFDNFSHSYSSGVGFFSVDSYPVNDSLAGSDITKIFTYDLPIYVSPTSGTAYDLRDCIDFRPRITDTANSVTSLSNISINPLTSTGVDLPSGGLRFIFPNESFTTDYNYYLKRKDLIVIDQDGTITDIRGNPSLFPSAPDQPKTSMILATVSVAPYPSLPDEIARRAQRPGMASAIVAVPNQRFTMADIGVLRDRIDRLEYYTSLSLLEQDSKNLLIPDASGLDRFKNGILVDSFTGHGTGNVYDPDYKASIDPIKGDLRPPFKIDNIELFNYSANSSGVVRTNVSADGVSADQTIYISNSQVNFSNNETVTSGAFSATLRFQVDNKLYIEGATGNFVAAATVTGGTSGKSATISTTDTTSPGELITLPYSHQVLVSQPYATTTRNATGLLYRYAGIVTLSPDSDYWVDTTQQPDVQVNFDFNTDNWIQLANSWQTEWGAWNTVVTGTPTGQTQDISQGTYVSGNQIIESVATQEATNVLTTSTRTGVRPSIIPTTQTQSLGARVTNVNIQPFMRSRVIRVTGTGFKPSARLYAFFDGTDVSAYMRPFSTSFAANTAAEGGSIIASSTGEVYAEFRIPAEAGLRFRTGDRVFRLTDNAQNASGLGLVTTSGEAIYSAQGLNTQTQDTIVSSRIPVLGTTSVNETTTINSTSWVTTGTEQRVIGNIAIEGQGGDDPIGQSFLVTPIQVARISGSGMFLSKIDLFFATKDSQFPVTVEIREMLNGNFTPNVVPFSRVTLPSSKVNVSSDGSNPTPFYFKSPVYLLSDREYAFVIRPGASNPNYSVFIATLGDTDILTGNRVTAQPASGVLFASSNDRTFTPIQEEDIKFTLYYSQFTKTNGTAVFKNETRDYFTIANVSSSFARAGEPIYGETMLVGTFANTKAVNTGVTFVQGVVSGATGTISTYSSTKIRVRTVSTGAMFKGGEVIKIRNTNPTTGVLIGNSSGGITSATTPTGYMTYYDAVNAANTFMHIANVSFSNSGAAGNLNRMFAQNTYIRGQIDGYTARIVSVDNLKMDVLSFNTDYVQPSNTSVAFNGRFATSSSTRDSSDVKLNINADTVFDVPRYVLSRSNESNTTSSSSGMAASRSAEIRIALSSNTIIGSPVIDCRRISATTIQNLINSNTAIGSSEDNVQHGGSAQTRYITRRVTLEDGQDAEDLKVYLTAYKPAAADVFVYYKVLNGDDSDTFDQARWIPMTQTTDSTVISDSQNSEDFREFEFHVPTYSNAYTSGANTATSAAGVLEYRNSLKARYVRFKYFAIKIVLTSTVSTNPPRVRDLRAIALQM